MTVKQLILLACAITLICISIYMTYNIIKYRKNTNYKVKEMNGDIFETFSFILFSIVFLCYFFKGFKV